MILLVAQAALAYLAALNPNSGEVPEFQPSSNESVRSAPALLPPSAASKKKAKKNADNGNAELQHHIVHPNSSVGIV